MAWPRVFGALTGNAPLTYLDDNFNAAIQNPLTTKGDVLAYSTVPARLAVGADGTVLQADSTQATGIKWATPAPATMTMKRGSGGGDYSTQSVTYVDVDAANLSYTVTVPVGRSLLINVAGVGTSSDPTGAVALAEDGSAVTECVFFQSGAPFALTYVFAGDGASHTWRLRFKGQAGKPTVISNGSATANTVMTFVMD